ncbi:mitogen-activated protein kinase kinase, partial [Lecanoromycetidae sp. Uapishka_2]
MSAPSTSSVPPAEANNPQGQESLESSKSQVVDFAQSSPTAQTPRLPSLRTANDSPVAANMTSSSSPLGNLNAARRPSMPQATFGSSRGSQLPSDMQAKMKAFHLSRQGAPPPQNLRMPPSAVGSLSTNHVPLSAGSPPGGIVTGSPTPSSIVSPGGALVGGPAALRLPPAAGGRPQAPNFPSSAPVVPGLNPKMGGLAAKRGLNKGMKLSDASGPPALSLAGSNPSPAGANDGVSKQAAGGKPSGDSLFSKYSEIVDTKTGTLRFKGKATIHGKGIDFSSGTSFNISLDEVDNLDELGKGNYGTVYKVRHSRPQMRRPGQGLAGNKPLPSTAATSMGTDKDENVSESNSPLSATTGSTTGMVMAMKEIRLELDEAKFAAIIMELDILHRCVSPFIVDFYGAFFQEGAVYICMEYMNGGSIDKLYGDGVPEGVLQKITLATVMGLKALKDDHNIIHRDVKPTNILVNTRGQVKICDFGVSGNLVASIAKTNIGCQSYMAPERISGGGVAQAGANPGGGTYSVQSDIWSLGLTIIECALGQYPYPPETYDNIFSQLSAIVDGDPPDLPADRFSEAARDFVRGALNKIPKLRPTYAMLLRHVWLAPLLKPATISEEDEDAVEEETTEGAVAPGVIDKEVAQWVTDAMERKRNGTMGKKAKPALHAAPLDAVPSPPAITANT